jgi:hypothetical protein
VPPLDSTASTSASASSLPYLADEPGLAAFIDAWRAGTLAKAEWTHAAHVAVCAWHAVADRRARVEWVPPDR